MASIRICDFILLKCLCFLASILDAAVNHREACVAKPTGVFTFHLTLRILVAFVTRKRIAVTENKSSKQKPKTK
ncbi:MAG: hypothetical protein VYA55_01950 [Pseudomonadota bacterium]|nr:hypothetical protein [Pseudomonadota bacterium]